MATLPLTNTGALIAALAAETVTFWVPLALAANPGTLEVYATEYECGLPETDSEEVENVATPLLNVTAGPLGVPS